MPVPWHTVVVQGMELPQDGSRRRREIYVFTIGVRLLQVWRQSQLAFQGQRRDYHPENPVGIGPCRTPAPCGVSEYASLSPRMAPCQEQGRSR